MSPDLNLRPHALGFEKNLLFGLSAADDFDRRCNTSGRQVPLVPFLEHLTIRPNSCSLFL